jgi:hypothetical protein
MSDIIVGGNDIIAIATGGAFTLEDPVRVMVGSDELGTTPATIMATYIINTLDKMTWPREKNFWPLYRSHMPDGYNVQDDCGCIFDTSGIQDSRQMNGRVPMHHGIQLMIRAKTNETGFTKIENIAASLDSIFRVSILVDATYYEIQNASRTTNVVSLGIEPESSKRRHLFTVNYLLTLKKLT